MVGIRICYAEVLRPRGDDSPISQSEGVPLTNELDDLPGDASEGGPEPADHLILQRECTGGVQPLGVGAWLGPARPASEPELDLASSRGGSIVSRLLTLWELL